MRLLIGAALLCTPLVAMEPEYGLVKKVYSHLLLHDPYTALLTAKRALLMFPDSEPLRIALICALCDQGEAIEALGHWKKVTAGSCEDKNSRRLLEKIAWGILSRAEDSSQFLVRVNALLGASFTKDARAIPIILEQLESSNALLRSLAVHQAATYGDAPFQEALMRLIKKEKVWFVRLEAIRAAGMLRMTQLIGELKEIVSNPKTLAEEKEIAIIALVTMLETIDTQELNQLLKSNRAGLRRLACELIIHLDQKDSAERLLPLLKDPSSDVRMAALNAFGLLGIKNYRNKSLFEQVKASLQDPHPAVSITAAWLSLLLGEKEGGERLVNWTLDEHPELRRTAAAALAVTGHRGVSHALAALEKSDDPYVQMTLALGLIGERQEIKRSSDILYETLVTQDALWMWDNRINPLFRHVGPSDARHREEIPQYPTLVDQMTRLEILSVLSVMRVDRAQEAIKGFLKKQSWGVTATAISSLLEEGDAETLSLVRTLLTDPDQKTRVQAALILGMLGGDASAVSVLHAAYPTLDREMKIHVLEALARIGDPSSIPFLVGLLDEPYAILRTIAASALIQCLYH